MNDLADKNTERVSFFSPAEVIKHMTKKSLFFKNC